MQRFALRPTGRKDERVLVAVPSGAPGWTIARRNRGLHRLLVPVETPLGAEGALRYIARLADHVATVHLVNVQRPLMTGDVTPLVAADTALQFRQAAGERILANVRRNVEPGTLRMTAEVAFGSPAETICAIAQPHRFSGIVIGRNGFALSDLIGRSVTAKIIQLARVPVTIVSARTPAMRAVGNGTRAQDVESANDQHLVASSAGATETREELA